MGGWEGCDWLVGGEWCMGGWLVFTKIIPAQFLPALAQRRGTQRHRSATAAWNVNAPAQFLPALAQRRGSKVGPTAATLFDLGNILGTLSNSGPVRSSRRHICSVLTNSFVSFLAVMTDLQSCSVIRYTVFSPGEICYLATCNALSGIIFQYTVRLMLRSYLPFHLASILVFCTFLLLNSSRQIS